LYPLVTCRADFLAYATGFIRRIRGFTGAAFLQTLVFGWLRDPKASLETLAFRLGLSRQALDQRVTPAAVAFCKAALLDALRDVVGATPLQPGVLRWFQGVYVDDCTQLELPDAAATAFPGGHRAGTGTPYARLKLLTRGELQGGALCHLGIYPGRTGDPTTLAEAPALPTGGLHLVDLGFTDFPRLNAEDAAGVRWVTRLPARTCLTLVAPGAERRPLWQQLRRWRQQGRTTVDVAAQVGDQVVAGRRVALACPPQVVARRLARLPKAAVHRGRTVSERQKEFCAWTVLFTNVPAEWVSAAEVWEVYRLRWQIELLFKRFKSEGGLRHGASGQVARVEAEWYLRLVGQVVRNWLQLLHGGPLRDVNGRQGWGVIGDWLRDVVRALRVGVVALGEVLVQPWEDLQKVRPRTRRQQRPTAAQRLQDQAASGSGAADRPEPAPTEGHTLVLGNPSQAQEKPLS
jgi:hypothetical protein